VVDCTTKNEGFEAAATEAVKHWKYEPARVNGALRAVFFTVSVDFKLRARKPNTALQPTGSAVTPRAGHASRQPAGG
jgi:hypothetical protein